MKLTWMTAIVFAMLAVPALAQDGSLQRNLDRHLDLTINPGLPIHEVFDKIAAQTNVKFVVSEDTLASLPYGSQTRLAISVKGLALRDALTPMLAPQALQWIVEDGVVRIMPSEPLYRMCRRATYDELQTLGRLNSARNGKGEDTRMTPLAGGEVEQQIQNITDQVRKITGQQNLNLVFRTFEDKRQQALARAAAALPGTAAQWLDALTMSADWTWYLWGEEIVIIDRKKQVERQLAKQVSLKYQNEQLSNVLTDLAKKGRVVLEMEAGVLQLLAPEMRSNFNLMMADATVSQALEVISGGTGLTFTRTGEGIKVEASSRLMATSQPAAKPRASFFVRAKLPGPGGTMVELFIRSDDLPDDVRAAIEAEKAKFLDELCRNLKNPASMPAAQTLPAEITD